MKTILGPIAFALFLSACGAGSAVLSNNPAPAQTQPAPSPSVQITTQPQNQTVTAGQSATFSVSATIVNPQAGDSLSYSWVIGSSSSNMQSVGTDSSTLTIPDVTTAQSGSIVEVSVSVVSDAPAVSSPATLVVTPVPTPTPSPAPEPAGFSTAVALQAPPNVTTAQNFSATIPQVPQGLVAVCFLMSDPALDLFNLSPSSDVTDSLNDNFQLATSQPQSVFYPPPSSATEQGCFIASTQGGSNVSITFNTQGLVNPAEVTAVALIYQGLHAMDSSLNFSIAPVSTGPCCANSQITYNQSPEWVLAIANASNDAVLGQGSGWQQRFFAKAAQGNFVIEDNVTPSSPVPGTMQVPFYFNYEPDSPGTLYTNAVGMTY